ncbi:MAG: hypothetical protein IPL86_17305 [Flavobacteriales bacterium]|nr:hypothetical protein [Flavobacteriales bacterium]
MHSHTFVDWPFGEAVNTAVITTKPVVSGGFPVLLVSHDHDGDWQFLCGTTARAEDCMLVCMGCAYQRDLSVGLLHAMPPGFQATRDSVDSPWLVEKFELEDDEDEGEGEGEGEGEA